MTARTRTSPTFTIVGLFTLLFLFLAPPAAHAAEPKIGDKVQIKLGENWVDATVTDVEGQRVRAKVAAGIESWFGPTDYRAGAAAPIPGTPATGTGTGKPDAKKPDAPKPPPYRPPTIVVGQKVETAFAGTWLPATVMARDGERTKVKLESGMENWVGPKEVRTIRIADPKFMAGLTTGSQVQANDGHRWLDATVVTRETNRFKIHWVDRPESWDKWLTPDKIRPRGQDLSIPDVAASAGDGGAGGATSAPGTEQPAATDVPRGDITGIRELHAEKETVTWAVKPDPGAAPAQPPATGPIPLGLKLNDREVVESIAFAPAPLPTATVVLYEPGWFNDPTKSRVVRVPLAGGRVPERVELPKAARLMDVSPDGAQLLIRQKVAELPNVLQIATLSGGKLTPTLTWKPYREEGEMIVAYFIDATHVLTCDKEGYAILWQLPAPPTAGAPAGQPKGVYKLKIGNEIRPTLSLGRHVLAAEAHGDLRFFDALTGAPLGGADVPAGGGSVTFRGDGAQIALTTPNRITLIDAASGKTLREVPLLPEFTQTGGYKGPPGGGTSTEYLPGGYLLLSRRYLVVPSQRLVTWDYRFPHAWPVGTFAGSVYYVGALRDGTGGLGLFSTKLPHDAAVKASGAMAVKIEELLVFRAGTGVTLDVSTDAPGDQRQKIQDAFEKQLKAMDLNLSGGGLRVSVRTDPGETKTQTYRVFGRGEQTVTATEKIHKVVVELDGKEMWSVQYRAGPSFFVTAKQGQSLEDAVRAGIDASYSWLAGVKIPRDIVRPDAYKVQGSSMLTANGIEPVRRVVE